MTRNGATKQPPSLTYSPRKDCEFAIEMLAGYASELTGDPILVLLHERAKRGGSWQSWRHQAHRWRRARPARHRQQPRQPRRRQLRRDNHQYDLASDWFKSNPSAFTPDNATGTVDAAATLLPEQGHELNAADDNRN
ncbi:hypothetical protein [Arthrobacter alpinus]|uniref:hypothetical protein n=1 Tax=Arthrobacter alpinus TaxID=656366 RepID=UPI001114F78D|nr:hypothetical protein [Arthrobacter alpinus]